MGRVLSFIYGFVVYVIMFLAFLYLFGFLANVIVPKGIDDGIQSSIGIALLVNLVLVGLFGISHSVMARPGFKQWWTNIVPKPIERSTYVLVATLIMYLIFWQWRPMEQVIWSVNAEWLRTAIWVLYVGGIVLLLASTFVINHFDLFGLRQVTLNLLKKPYSYLGFKVTFFYKFVRHPIYVGWLILFWATPDMTLGHLVFAIGMSTYILVAIPIEERDLVTYHGENYRQYKSKVPALIPSLSRVHETVKPRQTGDIT
jgi:protein-S-isoprenylcysteine O-methyltransferase Ste14